MAFHLIAIVYYKYGGEENMPKYQKYRKNFKNFVFYVLNYHIII